MGHEQIDERRARSPVRAPPDEMVVDGTSAKTSSISSAPRPDDVSAEEGLSRSPSALARPVSP